MSQAKSIAEQLRDATTPAAPAALAIPKITAGQLKVLRFVRSGDPYRDKGRGAPGRAARKRVLDGLRDIGLIRTLSTDPTFLRLTPRGKEVLLVNPSPGAGRPRKRESGPASRRA